MIAPLAYLDSGTPPKAAGPVQTVVFVHGDFSAGVYTWSRQIGALRDRCRIIAVDRRGHGRSTRRMERYTFAQDARDLLATLDALGVRRAHFAGHSYGGLVVLEAARSRKSEPVSLHLVEAPYLALLPDDPDVRKLVEEAGAANRLSPETPLDEIAFAFFKAVLGREGAARLREHKAWPTLVKDAERLVREEFAAQYPPSAIRDLPDLPIFVYAGGRSHPGLQKVARAIASRCRAPLTIFPEAGHDVPKSAEEFTSALLRNIEAASR